MGVVTPAVVTPVVVVAPLVVVDEPVAASVLEDVELASDGLWACMGWW